MAAGEAGGADTRFRADLEGLRAIAVVLVVLFHAGVTGLSGGYIGVDVFFVLSGYLITGVLVRELRSTDRVSLPSFYARRARRILPASFLVLAVSLVASAVLVSPIRFEAVAKDVAAAAIYVPNVRFALMQTDYWNPVAVSPILHFWSLGVEEQFYLLWPTFLVVVWRLGARSFRGLAFWVTAATVASLVLSVLLTPRNPTAAFYLLPTRAWELGLGAMLVFDGGWLGRLHPAATAVAGRAGLLMIGAAAVLFDERTQFPGVAALLPVVGTALLIAAGAAGRRTTWPRPLLVSRPMLFLGRTSYSLYLWHWPLLILGAVVAGDIAPAIHVPIEVALTVVLAAATYRWVEDPLRHGRLIGIIPRRNLSLALAASLCLVVVSVTTGLAAISPFVATGAAIAVPAGDPLAGLVPSATTSPPAGAISTATLTPSIGADPSASAIPSVTMTPSATPMPSPVATKDGPLPRNLLPSLLSPLAAGPAPLPKRRCGLNDPETVPPHCVDGDRSSETTVVLFGDSHAMQWFPALDRIALQRHWRLVTLVKAACPYEDITMLAGTRVFTECDTWRAIAFAQIATEHPAVVVIAGNHRLTPAAARANPGEASSLMLDAASRTIARLQSLGARVAVLGDTPHLAFDPIDCLSRNPDHTIRCAVDHSVLFDEAWLAGERQRALAADAVFVDTAPWLCPSEPCPVVIGRFLVYRDTNHLALPFSWALASRLDAALGP